MASRKTAPGALHGTGIKIHLIPPAAKPSRRAQIPSRPTFYRQSCGQVILYQKGTSKNDIRKSECSGSEKSLIGDGETDEEPARESGR